MRQAVPAAGDAQRVVAFVGEMRVTAATYVGLRRSSKMLKRLWNVTKIMRFGTELNDYSAGSFS